ncbi:MAG TPA: iron-containing alcohol dehydrogenase, partial [Turneriella sp.]|nr:iron-containing alcohol dehydrogenase [Turneriella sp.]
MTTYHFSFPTSITFGNGARHLVADHFKKHGFTTVLIVTDSGLASLPFFTEYVKELGKNGLTIPIFSGIQGNPTKSQVGAGAAAFKKSGAKAMLAIGGGAALDVAKAIALMAYHPGDIFDYEDEKSGALPVDKEIPYWVAIPTTAGTGSEVGRSAVVADDTTHVKKIIFSQ